MNIHTLDLEFQGLPHAIAAYLVEAPAGPVSLAEMERLHIGRVLRETGGTSMQAARLLAIDLKTLNKKIRDYTM